VRTTADSGGEQGPLPPSARNGPGESRQPHTSEPTYEAAAHKHSQSHHPAFCFSRFLSVSAGKGGTASQKHCREEKKIHTAGLPIYRVYSGSSREKCARTRRTWLARSLTLRPPRGTMNGLLSIIAHVLPQSRSAPETEDRWSRFASRRDALFAATGVRDPPGENSCREPHASKVPRTGGEKTPGTRSRVCVQKEDQAIISRS
jgi:hypothetical protein